MNEWLLSIGAAALLAAAEVGILLCSAALGAFAHMLLVGALMALAAVAVYQGRRFVLAQRRPDHGRS